MKVTVARRLSAPWLSAAELVRTTYAAQFGADVMPDPDCFIVGTSGDADAPVAACAGVSFASDRPFFSERYLDEPVEALIGRHFGAEPPRDGVVEIGPLAGGVARAGGEIIRVTPILAWCMGKQYILCTSTRKLSVQLRRVGIEFTPFARATADRLPAEDRPKWGTYYEQEPTVGVIALGALSRLFIECTGRYSFIDPAVDLLDAQQAVSRASA